jgi:hypothetical protein
MISGRERRGVHQDSDQAGERAGAAALEPLERAVFLVSELEVSCDKDGIDSFLNLYGPSEHDAVAEILGAAGAAETADGLTRIAREPTRRDDALLTTVNDLVTRHTGYDYDSLAKVVATRVAAKR